VDQGGGAARPRPGAAVIALGRSAKATRKTMGKDAGCSGAESAAATANTHGASALGDCLEGASFWFVEPGSTTAPVVRSMTASSGPCPEHKVTVTKR